MESFAAWMDLNYYPLLQLLIIVFPLLGMIAFSSLVVRLWVNVYKDARQKQFWMLGEEGTEIADTIMEDIPGLDRNELLLSINRWLER